MPASPTVLSDALDAAENPPRLPYRVALVDDLIEDANRLALLPDLPRKPFTVPPAAD